jgi:glutamyl-Q tRNA(Asp) synthetase
MAVRSPGGYCGRFAPSPTGALHAGSLVAALASWLDARAQGGRWWVRIEDVDTPRCIAGAGERILAQLDAVGLRPDAPPLWQSHRGAAYQAALDHLLQTGWAYPCGCSRRDIDTTLAAQGQPHQRFGERIYPGTCRGGLRGKPARATRLRTVDASGQDMRVTWHDRRLGLQAQHLAREVGDFVLQRADGLWAYQLAVVVDDAAQGVTDVVRGEDLADNTARQIHLQGLLGLATPRYLHTPLVRGADGHKLSKQNGALALDTADALATLRAAAQVLGLPDIEAATVPDWLAAATQAWAQAWPRPAGPTADVVHGRLPDPLCEPMCEPMPEPTHEPPCVRPGEPSPTASSADRPDQPSAPMA